MSSKVSGDKGLTMEGIAGVAPAPPVRSGFYNPRVCGGSQHSTVCCSPHHALNGNGKMPRGAIGLLNELP